jgi:hypothetical protein
MYRISINTICNKCVSAIAISDVQEMNIASLNQILSTVLTKELNEPVYFPKGDDDILITNYGEVCMVSVVELGYRQNVIQILIIYLINRQTRKNMRMPI